MGDAMKLKACPKCRAEYFDPVAICTDCGVPLVDPETVQADAQKSAKEEKVRANAKSVCVFKTTDGSKLLIAKNFLEEAGISYSVVGERTQHLFGIGTIGTGFNVITGQTQIFVLENDVESARQLLKELL